VKSTHPDFFFSCYKFLNGGILLSHTGVAQPLADIDEFCGKIKACKDEQRDPNFNVVARVEAFIAGWGLGEAIKRADAYRKAGADAILIHSKKSDPSEIDSFVKEWANRHPVVIVPTKYYTVPTSHWEKNKISVIIWANHNLRSAVAAMQNVSKQIFTDRSLINVEKNIVPVNEVFRLQNVDELKLAEKKYLPQKKDEKK
jgi:phosphoenolpyruvate phosphomutase